MFKKLPIISLHYIKITYCFYNHSAPKIMIIIFLSSLSSTSLSAKNIMTYSCNASCWSSHWWSWNFAFLLNNIKSVDNIQSKGLWDIMGGNTGIPINQVFINNWDHIFCLQYIIVFLWFVGILTAAVVSFPVF